MSQGQQQQHYQALKPPFPYTVYLVWPLGRGGMLCFDYDNAGRTKVQSVQMATEFNNRCQDAQIPEPITHPTRVHLPLPAGLSRLYPAMNGNVGLEFTGINALREFKASICDLGSISIKADLNTYRLYPGSKRAQFLS